MRKFVLVLVTLGLAACGSDSSNPGSGGAGGSGAGGAGGSGAGGAAGKGGAGGAAGKGGAGGAASAVPTNFGPGGWDCAGTNGNGSDCGCTHSPATQQKADLMCPAKFTCCELISISAGLSWYCNCYAKTDTECQADVASKAASGGAWRVPACPPR